MTKALVDSDKYANTTKSISILIEEIAEKYKMSIPEMVNDINILLQPAIKANEEYQNDR
jgi:hypothetical protein